MQQRLQRQQFGMLSNTCMFHELTCVVRQRITPVFVWQNIADSFKKAASAKTIARRMAHLLICYGMVCFFRNGRKPCHHNRLLNEFILLFKHGQRTLAPNFWNNENSWNKPSCIFSSWGKLCELRNWWVNNWKYTVFIVVLEYGIPAYRGTGIFMIRIRNNQKKIMDSH